MASNPADPPAASGAPAAPSSSASAASTGVGAPPRRDRLAVQRELLALVETTGELSSSRYEPRDLPSAITLARMIASSPLCPATLRGREADVLLVMMTGAEMGLSTMQAMRNLHVINGRIGMSAAMIRGRCQKHPECELFEVAEADAGHAAIEVKKRSWPERRLVAWTVEEAERAGLITADSLWNKWPQEMCVARATTRAASMFFPEVTSGVLSEEDLRDLPASDAQALAAAKAAQGTNGGRHGQADHAGDGAPPAHGAAPGNGATAGNGARAGNVARAGSGARPGNGATRGKAAATGAGSASPASSPALDAFAAAGEPAPRRRKGPAARGRRAAAGGVSPEDRAGVAQRAAAEEAAIGLDGSTLKRRKGPKRAPRAGRAALSKDGQAAGGRPPARQARKPA